MDFFFSTDYKEMQALGIKQLDVIIVSGEAYLDHPGSGASVMAHLLRAHGYTVGIIDQPDWTSGEDFKRLGSPGLFFGVTSGGLDSMLANYTPTKKKRRDDRSFSETHGSRPDRAVIVYCNRIREIYKDIPIVIGGVEASLRRTAHYDYWSDRLRRSVILDSRADILVYGMGERQILEIAGRLSRGEGLEGIRGTVIRVKKGFSAPSSSAHLPSFRQISESGDEFCRSFMMKERANSPFNTDYLIEEYEHSSILQYPPALPLSTEEMDYLYELPFSRMSHPKYLMPIKALEPILFSIITHRGCFGGCSFCSLAFHQGKIIQSRSIGSILREAEFLSKDPRFKGYLYDLGGPTANMFGMNCRKSGRGEDFTEVSSIIDGRCSRVSYDRNFCCNKTCLPGNCHKLSIDYTPQKELLREIRKIKGIKKAFIRSGIRFDLARRDEEYLYELVKYHISGQLKVAPEHVSSEVLHLMNKPQIEVFEEFSKIYSQINRKLSKKQYLVPYFIVAHPGAGKKEAGELKSYIEKKHIPVEQIQIFTPTPMTRSACMYYTGKDPASLKKIYITREIREKEEQKKMLF